MFLQYSGVSKNVRHMLKTRVEGFEFFSDYEECPPTCILRPVVLVVMSSLLHGRVWDNPGDYVVWCLGN